MTDSEIETEIRNVLLDKPSGIVFEETIVAALHIEFELSRDAILAVLKGSGKFKRTHDGWRCAGNGESSNAESALEPENELGGGELDFEDEDDDPFQNCRVFMPGFEVGTRILTYCKIDGRPVRLEGRVLECDGTYVKIQSDDGNVVSFAPHAN